MRLQLAKRSRQIAIPQIRSRCFAPRASDHRQIQISAAPTSQSPSVESDRSSHGPATVGADSPDARFEVSGAPCSLLSITLSASQNLFTRRGTLVGVSGKADNAISTLSLLAPFRRAVLGIPFLYQRITSTSPLTIHVSTKSPITSFAAVYLDGTVDWMIAQRRALLAWTGHSLSISPVLNRKMSLAHWGNSLVTGRGLLALVGKGQVYQITLPAGDEYIAHPSNVLAYTITPNPPLPYRLRSSSLRFQVPSIDLGSLLPDTKFFRAMGDSGTWRAITKAYFTVRTWSLRRIWGDRLFLQFHGPATILLQSRPSRLGEVLTNRDVNEIANAPAGSVQSALDVAETQKDGHRPTPNTRDKMTEAPTRLKVASIGRDDRVVFKDTDDFQSFSR